jgi:hypothetical protein
MNVNITVSDSDTITVTEGTGTTSLNLAIDLIVPVVNIGMTGIRGSNTVIDDTPVDGATTHSISSNWAYDHLAAADPHTGYRLESADHTHQTTGAQAGQLDHGLAMTSASLLDDDHTQYVLKSLYDADSVVCATSNDTPVAVTLAAQTVLGRLTGGHPDDISIGIADDNILQVDDATAADNDYAKFTAAGIEGVPYSTVLSDIGAIATTRTITATAPITIDGTTSADLSANRTIAITASNTTTAGSIVAATAPAAGLRNVLAIDNAETARSDKALFDATDPSTQAVGDTAVVGTAMTAARRDHKHAFTNPKLDDLSTPDNNTDLNANTTNHGLLLTAVAPAAGLTNIIAIENAETVYKLKALFDATDPSTQAFSDVAAVGTAVTAARRDHKHAMMAAPTSVSGNAGTVSTLAETSDTSCSIVFVTDVSGSLPLKTNTNMTFNSSTGVATFASAVLTTADINGGTVDGAIIGGSTAAAITCTTLNTGGKLTAGANEIECSNVDITGGTITGITDIAVADGGTGASTLTDHGVLLGSGTDAVTALTALAAGELLVGVGSADPHALAAGATTKILVGGGAADPVWTEATGSGAPVRATAPTLTTVTLSTAIADNTSTTQGATTAYVVSQDNLQKTYETANLCSKIQYPLPTSAYMLKAGTDGEPVTATNTDTDVADAVTKKHTQHTDTGTTATSFKINSGGSEADIQTTGLTGDRDYTFPDVDTMIAGAALTAENGRESIPYATETHIADAKVNYATPDLDTEAEVITAFNTTNGIINSILARLESAGISKTA